MVVEGVVMVSLKNTNVSDYESGLVNLGLVHIVH